MSANKAVAIGFAITTLIGWSVVTVLRLVLDANGQVMAIAAIILISIFSFSLTEIDRRFSATHRR